jgi:hypothetical protein
MLRSALEIVLSSPKAHLRMKGIAHACQLLGHKTTHGDMQHPCRSASRGRSAHRMRTSGEEPRCRRKALILLCIACTLVCERQATTCQNLKSTSTIKF